MENLSGNAILCAYNIVNLDYIRSGANIGDIIKTTGKFSSNHKIFVSDNNTCGATGVESVYVAEIADGGAKFTLTNPFNYVDVCAY